VKRKGKGKTNEKGKTKENMYDRLWHFVPVGKYRPIHNDFLVSGGLAGTK
jgi:hypothetical protein